MDPNADNHTTDHQDAIFRAAKECQTAFEHITTSGNSDPAVAARISVLLTQDDRIATQSTRTLDDIRADYEQFRVWAANIGVFADGQTSLDFRLRDAADLRDGFIALLESLNTELHNCTNMIAFDPPRVQTAMYCESCSDSSSNTDESLRSDEYVSSSVKLVAAELQFRLRHVSDIVDKLVRLAEIIRASSGKSRVSKASTYQHWENGVDMTQQFEEQYLPEILEHRFKLKDSKLCARLIKAISSRRRYFMYMSRRQQRLAYGGELCKKPLQGQTDLVTPRRHQISEVSLTAHKPITTMPNVQPVSEMRSVPTRATSFTMLDLKLKVPSRIISTSTRTTAGRVSIPPPPILASRATHAQCPYCCLLVPRQRLQQKDWRVHLIADLQPFVCIEPDCLNPVNMFETREHWVEHQAWEHSMEWWCDDHATEHGSVVFQTAQEYSEHLACTHGTSDPLHVSKLTATAGRPSLTAFNCCPFCDFKPKNVHTGCKGEDSISAVRFSQKELQEHIEDELLTMFLLALPERDDLGEYQSDAESVTRKRSTIGGLSDIALTFTSSPPNSETEQQLSVIDYHLRRYRNETPASTIAPAHTPDQDTFDKQRTSQESGGMNGCPVETSQKQTGPWTADMDNILFVTEAQEIQGKQISTANPLHESAIVCHELYGGAPSCDPDICKAVWQRVWDSPEMQSSVRRAYLGPGDDEILQAIASKQIMAIGLQDQAREKLKWEQWFKLLAFEGMDDQFASVPEPCPGTAKWFTGMPIYTHWLRAHGHGKGSVTKFLWLTGSKGSGKSVLMKHVASLGASSGVSISFFFRNNGTNLQTSPEGMYRALIVQLCQLHPTLKSLLGIQMNGDRNHSYWDLTGLKKTFISLISKLTMDGHLVLCFLDGMNHSTVDNSEYEHITSIWSEGHRFRLLCSSSELPGSASDSHQPTFLNLADFIVLENRSHSEDITLFVKSYLSCSFVNCDQLVDSIVKKSQGIFLWAVVLSNLIKHDSRYVRIVERDSEHVEQAIRPIFRHLVRRNFVSQEELTVIRILSSHHFVSVSSDDGYGSTPLLSAVWAGNSDVVQALLTQNGPLSNSGGDGFITPLNRAIELGLLEVTESLLADSRIDINFKDRYDCTPLMMAIRYSRLAVIERLITRRDLHVNARNNRGMTALMFTMAKCTLIDGNYKSQGVAGHIVSLLSTHPAIDFNTRDFDNCTALMQAVMSGDPRMVELLLNTGNCDVNLVDSSNETPLIRAVILDSKEIVSLLLQAGEIQVNMVDSFGQTALIRAVTKDDPEAVKLLLAAKDIDVHIRDFEHKTALIHAEELGLLEIVGLLLVSEGKTTTCSYSNYGKVWQTLR